MQKTFFTLVRPFIGGTRTMYGIPSDCEPCDCAGHLTTAKSLPPSQDDAEARQNFLWTVHQFDLFVDST